MDTIGQLIKMKMRNLFGSTFILLLISFGLQGQTEQIVALEDQYSNTTIIQPGVPIYYKDVNNLLDKYVGTWIYNDGINYLEITITKLEHETQGWPGKINDPDFEDLVVLRMIFKINGLVKYNTMSQGPTITGNFIKSNNIIELFYYEPSLTNCPKTRNADLVLEYLSGNPAKLKWERKNTSSGYSPLDCPNGPNNDSPFLIPENLTLTKQ